MNICKGKTKNNKKCKNKCSNNFCYLHKKGGGKMCGRKGVENYKIPCNKVWNGNCGHNFKKNENIEWRKNVLECAKKRSQYMNDCIDAKDWDVGHVGAISKMVQKRVQCDMIIPNQYQLPKNIIEKQKKQQKSNKKQQKSNKKQK